jgi:hypothetical protein
VLQHGHHPFITLGLPTFLHQTRPSQQHHDNIITTSRQPHSNQGTSIIVLGEISGIGIGNRAGNPLYLRHFDTKWLATLKGWQPVNTSALGALLERQMWASETAR